LWKARLARAWPFIRFIGGLGLAALALSALMGQRGELSGSETYLAGANWLWILVAVAAELASLMALAVVQCLLFSAGHVPVGVRRMTAITLAVNAITNSLPAGTVISTVFGFRQYRREGADQGLAAWVLIAFYVLLFVTLALMAAVGVGIAGGEGASLNLVEVTVGVLLFSLAVAVLFVQKRALIWAVTASLHACRRLTGWPRGEIGEHIDRIIGRLTVVTLTARQLARTAAWTMANWLFDCACLALSFSAVHAAIPWRGLLLAYGAGQLAANLPITPGGLGVVEGSLTIALVAYGGVEVSTVAAVLLYRIISFWAELPVGWVAWGWLTWRGRSPFAAMVKAVSGRRGEAEVVS
jgi:hypothetical protein